MLRTPFYRKPEGHIPDFASCVGGAFQRIQFLERTGKNMWPYKDLARIASKMMKGRLAYDVHFSLREDSADLAPPDALTIGAAYCHEAVKLFEDGRPDAAWSCLLQGYYFIGKASGPQTVSEAASKSRSGHKGRDGKYRRIRELAKTLLVDRRPEDGWATRAAAIEAIVKDLNDLHQTLFETHFEQSNQLKKWGETGGSLRPEFEVAVPSLLRRKPRRVGARA